MAFCGSVVSCDLLSLSLSLTHSLTHTVTSYCEINSLPAPHSHILGILIKVNVIIFNCTAFWDDRLQGKQGFHLHPQLLLSQDGAHNNKLLKTKYGTSEQADRQGN